MGEDEMQAKAQQTMQALNEAKQQATQRVRQSHDRRTQGEPGQAQSTDDLQPDLGDRPSATPVDAD